MRLAIKQLTTLIMTFVFLGFGISSAQAERNPFELPQGVFYLSDLKMEVPDTTNLTLQAVTMGETQSIATINGLNYKVNELVHGQRLVQIYSDHVVLRGAESEVTLRLKRKPFSVRVKRPSP